MSTTQPASREVATRTPLQELVAQVRSDDFKGQIANALPGNITPQRFQRVALTAIMQNPAIVRAERTSIFQALIRCAQDGLLPDGREAAITDRKDKERGRIAVYMPMVGGLRKIAAKHGITLVADVVYANDEFEWSRMPPRVEHKPAMGVERGEIVCAYAAAFDREWRFVAAPVVMDVPEINKVRAVSTAPGGPWTSWWDRMACKTVARRLFKELPLGDLDEHEARLVDASDADTDFGAGGLTVDEANIAAGLSNLHPPDRGGPDDRAVDRPLTGEVAGADTPPADREHHEGEIEGEATEDDEPVADAGQHGQLAELIVQLVDHDGETDWRAAAHQYAEQEFGSPLDELRVSEFDALLGFLRAQLPPKTTTRRRTP